MIIGIDANALAREKLTGTERYVKELLLAMQKTPLQENEEVHLYVSKPLPIFENLPKGWKQVVLKWPPKKVWTHARLSLHLVLNPPDIFFSPAHEIPLFYRTGKIITTVHDIAFKIMPGIYGEKNRRRQEWAVRRALLNAKRILTVSKTTKNDLMNYYRVPEAIITPTPLGINPDRMECKGEEVKTVCRQYKVPEYEYFLSVGRVEKKKNIGMLVQAFEQYRQNGGQAHLVLAGSLGDGGEQLKNQIQKSPVSRYMHLLGYVPDEHLPALMNGALAYVFPTNYEGFGIPALEAFASHIPLIASNIPALNEVAGGAAMYARKDDASAWARSMKKIEEDEDLRAKLVFKGQSRLKDFTWEQTARKTWEAIRAL